MALLLIIKVPTPVDHQKEPCPRPHHRRSTLSLSSWPPLPISAGSPARVWWVLWRRCPIRGPLTRFLAALEVGGCPPCESTIRRTLQRLDGDELDTAMGGWAAARTKPPAGRRRVVALDGKTVRGSASDAADARHLLGSIDQRTAVVLGQVNVERKTNEISMFPLLCECIDDLSDAVITADALHAQRSHADYLVLQRRAHYLLTVKGNQPHLLHQLKTLPWKDVPAAHTSTTRAHGRVKQRCVKLVTVATGIVFPHARQAIQITRKTRRLDSKKWTTEVVYAITSLTTKQATATDLATWIRGH